METTRVARVRAAATGSRGAKNRLSMQECQGRKARGKGQSDKTTKEKRAGYMN